MKWDPTDYKDMLDDDWNSIHEQVKQKWEEMAGVGYDLNSIVSEVCQILGNMMAYEDILNYACKTKSLKKIISYVMDKFYLTPIQRKRAKKKYNKIKENVNEAFDESKVAKDTDIKPQKYLSESVYEFLNENKSRYDSLNDDELEHLRRYGIIRGQEYFAKMFQRLCQKAAEAGLEFDIIQDLVTQALDQVDWNTRHNR